MSQRNAALAVFLLLVPGGCENGAPDSVYAFEPVTLEFPPEGGSSRIVSPEAEIPWDQAKYLVFDAFHNTDHSLTLSLQFFKEDEDEPQIRVHWGLMPNLQTRIIFPLEALDGQSIFLPRQPRSLKGNVRGRRLPVEMIGKVELGLFPSPSEQKVTISGIHLSSRMPARLTGGSPVVDELGQWKQKSWPGKTGDEAELKADFARRLQEVKDSSFPEGWSSYGGWKEKQFEATGFFRTEHDGRRWWLVDPQGYAFYSIGVDGVGPTASGPVEGMEDLFAWIPPREGEFEEAWSRNSSQVSFATANLIRAFGSQWEEPWQELTRGLMLKWRFNSIANWSDLSFARKAKLPYVIPLRGYPTTEILLYRDFPDVYDPAYAEAAIDYAGQLESYKDDPYLIGYFLDNEPHWAFGQNNLAAEMIATETPSHTRSALVSWLRERYQGDVTALAEAWKHSFTSFEQLDTQSLLEADELSEKAAADLWEFSGLMVDRYVNTVCEEVEKVDPNHLNLGLRYASISSDLCYRAGEYFDVFSINSYRMEPPADVIAEISRRTGRPVLIGEFHFGALDRGLPSTGLRGVASQEERGVAYRYYLEQGALIPELIGMHYFIWNDQPVLGRFDGENYNIGLVDVCGVPYTELVSAATATHERFYRVAAGELEPFSRPAQEIPRVAF